MTDTKRVPPTSTVPPKEGRSTSETQGDFDPALLRILEEVRIHGVPCPSWRNVVIEDVSKDLAPGQLLRAALKSQERLRSRIDRIQNVLTTNEGSD